MKNYAVMEEGVAAVLTSLENTKLKEVRKYHVLQTWTVQSGLVHREGIQIPVDTNQWTYGWYLNYSPMKVFDFMSQTPSDPPA